MPKIGKKPRFKPQILMYQLITYIPEDALESVKAALFAAGAGTIGNYAHCAWQVRGEGQFLPLSGSHPHIGENGELCRLPEWRVEMVLTEACKEAVIAALHASHPYETPAFSLIKLDNP